MKIGNVIRKYRKEAGMTQEEMANLLGVTTPAVNKWENGYTNPDIELLAPIARLLHISLDTLMSFHELTSNEISDIIRRMDQMFESEGYEKTYEWALERIREYPGCNMLIWRVAVVLDARRQLGPCAEPEQYDGQIRAWYEAALRDESEEIRHHAADSLLGFYLRKKEYARAEECLQYFSDYDPLKYLYRGRLYKEQGKTREADEAFEEYLFSLYQSLMSSLAFMIGLELAGGSREKARFLAQKQRAISRAFEMEGDADAGNGKAPDLAVIQLKDMFSYCPDFSKSRLFEHMNPDKFFKKNPEPQFSRLAGIVGAGSVWVEGEALWEIK